MSRSRRLRRQRAAAGLALELICLFFLGFVASSVVGITVAWVLGMHHPEFSPLDEDSRVLAPYTEARV
jgi:fatty acid desaturase